MTWGRSELGHFELQREHFFSHSPPAPPLSYQALFLSLPLLSTLSFLSDLPSYTPTFLPLAPLCFSQIFPPFHSPPTSLMRHTHISLKPISLYLFIGHPSRFSLFSILCFSPSLSSLYLFQSSHMWIWLLGLMQHIQLKAAGWGVGVCLI